MLLFFLIQSCFADPYILCNRDTEISPHLPDATSEEDPCTGGVILQGISYECVPVDEVSALTQKFFSKLKTETREYCDEYCSKRSTKKTKCRGNFQTPSKCGFSVPPRDAIRFGKNDALCRPTCRGQAFAYCSLYHASYLRTDDFLFKGKKPNCHCYKVGENNNAY